MILQVILEGIGLGVLLILVCAIGIRKGAVGMVHLYSPEVQERCVTLGLTTHAKIKRNALIFKAVCVPGYIAYVLVCVYALNGAKGFVQGFWQLLVILSVESHWEQDLTKVPGLVDRVTQDLDAILRDGMRAAVKPLC